MSNPDCRASEPPAAAEPEWDLVIEDDEFGVVHPGDSFDLFEEGRVSVIGKMHITVGELVEHLWRGLSPQEVAYVRRQLSSALDAAEALTDRERLHPTEEAKYPEACGALKGAIGVVLGYLDLKGRRP